MKIPQLFLSLLASSAVLVAINLYASTTQPVGFSTWTIESGFDNARSISVLGAPLYQPATSIDGAAKGTITSVSANSITVSNAGWQPGQLSNVQAPFVLRITSGVAKGRNLLISTSDSNTTDTVVIDRELSDVPELNELGIVAGETPDTFEIVECDTLSSLFGAPEDGVVIGGSTSESSDVIFLLGPDGFWESYFYDTGENRWTKLERGFPDASNKPILPDAGILYSRLSEQSTELVLTGTVPNSEREVTVNGSGVTFLSSAYPVDVKLSQTGISDIEGWVKNSDSSASDIVFVHTEGFWERFYNDGTNWRQIARGNPISDDVVIPMGSSILLLRRNAASQDLVLNQNLPYSL